MKLCDIALNESRSLDDLKSSSGYHEEFPSIAGVWADTFLRLLRYEAPYEGKKSAKAFSDKVESFFTNKYGTMVYYKGDERLIAKVYNSTWDALENDPSVTNIKDQIRQTSLDLNRLRKAGKIAPEGSHSYETDFWSDQQEKDDYMGRDR